MAAAHSGGTPTLIVPVDHVNPGEQFPVIGADLGSDAEITLRLVQGDRSVELGTVVAGPDGHFETQLRLPADFPPGYAELVASGDDGSRTSTYLLSGPRTDSTPAPPNQPQWWQDPAVILLAGGLGGGAALLAWMMLRSARHECAAVTAAAIPRRQPARRKTCRR